MAANFGLVGIGEDTGGSIRIPASFNNLFGLRVTTGLISRSGFSPLSTSRTPQVRSDGRSPTLRKFSTPSLATTRQDPYTVTGLAGPPVGGYAQALTVDVPFGSWRIGVLESGFDVDGDPDADPVNRAVRSAIGYSRRTWVSMIPALEIEDFLSGSPILPSTQGSPSPISPHFRGSSPMPRCRVSRRSMSVAVSPA